MIDGVCITPENGGVCIAQNGGVCIAQNGGVCIAQEMVVSV